MDTHNKLYLGDPLGLLDFQHKVSTAQLLKASQYFAVDICKKHINQGEGITEAIYPFLRVGQPLVFPSSWPETAKCISEIVFDYYLQLGICGCGGIS